MSTPKDVRITVQRILGAASIFRQGGSLRVILPKKALGALKMPRDPEESEIPTVILIATDKGILMRQLSDYLQDEDMRIT
jgi:hypothetical protein